MEYAWRIFGSIDTQRRGGYASIEIAGDGEVSEKNGMPRYADPVSLSEPFANPFASFVGSFFIADTLVLPPPPNNYNSRGRNPGSNAFASPSLTVIQSTRRRVFNFNTEAHLLSVSEWTDEDKLLSEIR